MKIILFKVPNCQPYRSCIDKRQHINKSDKKRMEDHVVNLCLCLNTCTYLVAITLHEPLFFFSVQSPKAENKHLRREKILLKNDKF